MTARSRSNIVVYNHPFLLPAVDRVLPAGGYRVVTDEELIDGLSFSAYRRVSTMIFVPALGHEASSIEMVTVDPSELKAAQEIWPKIQFHTMREHGGLVVHSNKIAA